MITDTVALAVVATSVALVFSLGLVALLLTSHLKQTRQLEARIDMLGRHLEQDEAVIDELVAHVYRERNARAHTMSMH